MKIETINAVVMLPAANLTAPERNAKLHTDEQVTHIMNSIKEFGMNDPIGVWGDKNIIVEGAGRWEACKRLAIESVPCIQCGRKYSLYLDGLASRGCLLRVRFLRPL